MTGAGTIHEGAKKLWNLLEGSRDVVVVTHTHPDGDAIGSASAMQIFLKQTLGKEHVSLLIPDSCGRHLDFIPGERIVCEENPAEARTLVEKADLILVLDLNRLSRAERLGEMVAESSATKVLVDHHLSPAVEEFDLIFSKTDISSASEYLYSILLEMPPIAGDASRLPSDCATALMTGMTTDTNNFANSVFPSTLSMASELLAAGVDRDRILDRLYNNCRENRVKAMSWLLSNELKLYGNGFACIVITKEISERFDLAEGETEGLVNIPLTIGKVTVSALLKEDDGFFRVSLRSRKPYTVNDIAAKYFHGGGHAQASGGKLLIPEDIPEPSEVLKYLEESSAQFMENIYGKK